MTDDIDDDGDIVELKYNLYTDEKNLSVHLDFNGFHNKEELDEFSEYIIKYLPLILFSSDVKH